MISAGETDSTRSGLLILLLRVLLGGMFIYLGVLKIEDPVAFLKGVREYHLVPESVPLGLNFIAAILPWAEVMLGGLLIVGIGIRGAALVAAVLLITFTSAIALRAHSIQAGASIPFCEVAFDCGCGNGVQPVCRKLTENGLLILLSLVILFTDVRRFAIWPRLVASPR